MDLRKLLRGAPAAGGEGEAEPSPRRRRRPRPDGPRTIVPVVGEPGDADAGRPSWLPAERDPHRSLTLDLDAARERLRREIPPVAEDEI